MYVPTLSIRIPGLRPLQKLRGADGRGEENSRWPSYAALDRVYGTWTGQGQSAPTARKRSLKFCPNCVMRGGRFLG